MDLHRGLAVRRRGEHLRSARGDGGVPLDEPCEDAPEGLDPEGERGHVEEQQVLDVAGEHARLHGRSHRHYLVGVDTLVRLLPEVVLDHLLDLRHAGLAPDENDLVDPSRLDPRVLEALTDGAHRPVEEVADELLELRPGQAQAQVLGTGGVGGDERQVHLRLHRCEPGPNHPLPAKCRAGLKHTFESYAEVTARGAVQRRP